MDLEDINKNLARWRDCIVQPLIIPDDDLLSSDTSLDTPPPDPSLNNNLSSGPSSEESENEVTCLRLSAHDYVLSTIQFNVNQSECDVRASADQIEIIDGPVEQIQALRIEFPEPYEFNQNDVSAGTDTNCDAHNLLTDVVLNSMSEISISADEDNEEDFVNDLDFIDNDGAIVDMRNMCMDGDFINKKSDFPKLREILDDPSTNEIVDIPIIASKAEMLLAVIKFALIHSLSMSGLTDLMAMVNSFVQSDILPQSLFLLDKLFSTPDGLEYHAICPSCKLYVGRFQRKDRDVECQNCHKRVFLKDPTYNDFFCIMNVDNQIAHLVQQNADHYIEVQIKRMQNSDVIKDIVDGAMYKKLAKAMSEEDSMNFITTNVNTDGVPLFESSQCSIWPIQMIQMQPITCGICFGKYKPTMNIFLRPFVDYMNKLAHNGLSIKINGVDRLTKVFFCCCPVDSVARAPMQGVLQFNAHYGCNWYLHQGEYVRTGRGGAVKYTLTEAPVVQRCEESMLDHIETSLASGSSFMGVICASPLINLEKFDVIRGFVPDYMHSVCLGISEKFTNYWFGPNGLLSGQITVIDEIMKNIKIPLKVHRLSRGLSEKSWWKSKEWENWLLYYSIPILRTYPTLGPYLNHWALFVSSMYILLGDDISRENVVEAHDLLVRFVTGTEDFYGKGAMTFNVHQMLHIVQSHRLGPLKSHSCYSFESGNGQLIKKVHAAKGVIHQIIRSLQIGQSEIILHNNILLNNPQSPVLKYVNRFQNKYVKKTLKTNSARYFGNGVLPKQFWIQTLQLSNESRMYKKCVKNRCLYTSCKKNRLRSDNSYAITQDGEYVQLHEFIVDVANERELAICSVIETTSIFEDVPLSIKLVNHVRKETVVRNINSIDRSCVLITVLEQSYI